MRVLAVSGNTLRPPREAVETAGRGPMSHLCGDDEETANLRPHYHIAPVLAPVSGGSASIPAGGGSVPRSSARKGFSVRRPGRIESRAAAYAESPLWRPGSSFMIFCVVVKRAVRRPSSDGPVSSMVSVDAPYPFPWPVVTIALEGEPHRRRIGARVRTPGQTV